MIDQHVPILVTRPSRVILFSRLRGRLGIAFGLSSDRVQGAARDLPVVMIALAAVLALLLVTGRRNRRSVADRAVSTEEAK
jgi:hypothetical protein